MSPARRKSATSAASSIAGRLAGAVDTVAVVDTKVVAVTAVAVATVEAATVAVMVVATVEAATVAVVTDPLGSRASS